MIDSILCQDLKSSDCTRTLYMYCSSLRRFDRVTEDISNDQQIDIPMILFIKRVTFINRELIFLKTRDL